MPYKVFNILTHERIATTQQLNQAWAVVRTHEKALGVLSNTKRDELQKQFTIYNRVNYDCNVDIQTVYTCVSSDEHEPHTLAGKVVITLDNKVFSLLFDRLNRCHIYDITQTKQIKHEPIELNIGFLNHNIHDVIKHLANIENNDKKQKLLKQIEELKQQIERL